MGAALIVVLDLSGGSAPVHRIRVLEARSAVSLAEPVPAPSLEPDSQMLARIAKILLPRPTQPPQRLLSHFRRAASMPTGRRWNACQRH